MAESLTEYFAKSCRKRFGIIKGITDKDYLTNSFHVNVTEKINAFDKLKYEGQFAKYSSGGFISYVELPNLQHNTEAIVKLMQYGYEVSQYFEFNTKLDVCQECNYEGEMLLDNNNEWYCPNCGNRDTRNMTIVRRTCG
jgi:ribonucleoside-triphosphate reductase